MKKSVLICIAAMMAVVAAAQNPTADIEAKYKKEKGFASYTVDANMLKMALMMPGLDEGMRSMLTQTTEQTTMVLDNASLAAAFVKDAIAAYDKVGYTESQVVEDAKKGVTGKAYAKMEGDYITEIAVVLSFKKQGCVQILKGKYDKEMLKTATENAMTDGKK